jgi:hypothetical protein
MKFFVPGLVAVLWLTTCVSANPTNSVAEPAPQSAGFTLFMIGDSTMADRTVIPALARYLRK